MSAASAAHLSSAASLSPSMEKEPKDEEPSAARSSAYLRDQAWTLYCHGEHSPTIAVELEVPERTVRSWLQ